MVTGPEESGPPEPGGEEQVPEELREFGHFRLLKVLGRGAQGVVYLAEDTNLERKVALKMLEGGSSLLRVVRERFQREATVASRLDHPGICGVHEIGEVEGLQYIAMQYVRGETLGEMVERASAGQAGDGAGARSETSSTVTTLTGKDALQDVLRLIERAARALHVAHEAGLVHRDVKPGNIMVTQEGHPVLLDFGLAREVEDHGLTETGQVLGTPAYMAPEQLRGQRDRIDRRTDVYALGVTLFECLTLRRPFSSETFEGLFQQILEGHPVSPRRLNPRIPRDLATVIEVAMESDRERRYESALELAEDLRRVRLFEPIKASAAGPVTRARKWARRNPGPAVAILAGVLLLLLGVGFWIGDGLSRRAEARAQLGKARGLMESRDFDGALVAVSRARDLRGDSLAALELERAIEATREEDQREERRREDLADAAQARQEAARLQADYEERRIGIRALRDDLAAQRSSIFAGFASDAERSAFAARELELDRARLAAEQVLQEVREQLELAVRREAPWGGTPETSAALAGLYVGLWREAIADGDGTRAAVLEPLVRQHDAGERYADELLGRGELSVGVVPADAQVHLYRFEPYDRVRPDAVVPRLVPVPTRGVGRSRPAAWVDGFHPGDGCLVIEEVEPGSPGDAEGLRPGDLVLRLAGQPAFEGLFLARRPDRGPLAEAGVGALARVLTLNGARVASLFEWSLAPSSGAGRPDELALAGFERAIACDRREPELLPARALIEEGCPDEPLELDCLRSGEPLRLVVPAGTRSGLRCEPSAYPLIQSPENLVAAGAALEVEPGSFLLLVRREGYEAQRYPVVVERLGRVAVSVELLETGSTPEGFVYVPPGPFLRGGDELAVGFAPGEMVDVAGFFMARREVDNEAWTEFLFDPDVRAKGAAAPSLIHVPREMPGPHPIPQRNLGGPDTPVMGISWFDARDFVEWCNARAEADGEPWVYDLPTELEWEKAARSVDGRAFPWGDRFDFDLVVGLHHARIGLYNAPGGIEPRDESPYGVQDLGGHRREWLRDVHPMSDPTAPPFFRWRGGAWWSAREEEFRSASRFYSDGTYTGGNSGMRLVARPRD